MTLMDVFWGALIVVSLIQFCKNYVPVSMNGKIWGLIALPLYFLVAFFFLSLPAWFLLGLKLFVVGQLGYENLIKPLHKFVDTNFGKDSSPKQE